MTKEDIRTIIEFTNRNGGSYTCTYIPSEELTPEYCDALYYGGAQEIRINSNGFSLRHEYVNMEEYGVENAINRIHEVLIDNIGGELHKAVNNLGWEYEELKYFDRNPDQFTKFKNEINRLRRDKKLAEIL